MSSWSLRSSRSGGWRKTEHARITAALVLRKGRPAARKVYKLIPDIPVLRQSSKPRVFVRYAQAFVVGGHVDCTPLMQDRLGPTKASKADLALAGAAHGRLLPTRRRVECRAPSRPRPRPKKTWPHYRPPAAQTRACVRQTTPLRDET